MDERQDLAGCTILIVEDRYLIASELADEVRSLGGDVLGPAASLSMAGEVLGDRRPDVALLDVNLDGELVFPLAEEMEARRAAIVFLTGYEETLLPERWRGYLRLDKPVDSRSLREALRRVLNAAGERRCA
jgi:DNA-binding response OmpR family regulator